MPIGIVANPMPSGCTWLRSSCERVTECGSLVHPFEKGEPYGQFDVENWSRVGQFAADLGHLEAGDALQRRARPVYGLVHRRLDRWAGCGDIDRLSHHRRILL